MMKNITGSVAQDCTDKGSSIQHGNIINATISSREISDKDLCSYIKYVCERCEHVADTVGRNALHLAASCGRNDLVQWLVECREADINIRDKESGYTALHRSVYYGKIHTTVELIKLGANIDIQDYDGLTFLDHIVLDRYQPLSISTSGEVFTWGSNSNNTLGSQQARDFPELMNIFHKTHCNEDVKMFLINHFHSIILTESGIVYSCGHGHGGRLGLGTKHTELIPRQIKFDNNVPGNEIIQIKACCIARDHSLFLSSNGMVFSCGLNKHRVLGIKPAPENLLTPKPLRFSSDHLISVACGDYHSVVWSKTNLFTWGLNAGQLGHHLNNLGDDKYILTPKKVKFVDFESNKIKTVCASTGATVIATERGDIFVLQEYQCKKIARVNNLIVDISVIGGKLNNSLDQDLSGKNRELRVVVLVDSGTIFTWHTADPVMRQCNFFLKRPVSVKQLCLNIEQILLVTEDGEAFKGTFKPRRKKISYHNNDKNKSEFHKLVEKDDFAAIKLEKIQRIHRAIYIGSDPKGQNFGVIQDRPYKEFDCICFSESCRYSILTDGFHDLLETINPDDGLIDVTLTVDNREYFAHKYILASRSTYFSKIFAENPQKSTVNLEKVDPECFNQVLKFIYTRSCDITSGNLNNRTTRWLCEKWNSNNAKNEQKTKNCNFARIFREIAQKFHLDDLKQLLVETELEIHMDGDNMIQNWIKPLENVTLPAVIFDRKLFPELYDVDIQCSDGAVLRAHKCLLVARSEYFSSMFSVRWISGSYSKISLPFAKEIVECLLDFLYADSFVKLEGKELEQVCEVLKLADLTLTTKLRQESENILSRLLTIKNTVPLLTLAAMVNADGLRVNCYRFIQQNLSSFLELRLLDDLDNNLLHEFSVFYQDNRKFEYRQITPYSTAVSVDEVVKIASERPVSFKKEPRKNTKNRREETAKRISFSHDVSVSTNNISTENHKIKLSSSLETSTPISTPHGSPEAPKVNHTFDSFLESRVKAVTAANNLDSSSIDTDNFTPLKKSSGGSLSSSFVDDFQFPLLNSPPRGTVFHHTGNKSSNHKAEFKQKTPKMSQKQRKRLSSENGTVVTSPILSESPKNPWKSLPDPTPVVNLNDERNMDSIIHDEKKQRENLVKMKNKPLALTQLEDKAMDELKRFYSIDSVEDELIFIERVTSGAMATPVWVPK
ncbi:inhibitor of Bruton tyrosine kinase isoform X2 [Rhynchophorus ferrugineus]|uniref:inhibitor of Bruton tyrosine kinase isoform X2 n=1 Tax=Rhynchophorus ferrugineus TaxID=354439 RepID=UPI003FCE1062